MSLFTLAGATSAAADVSPASPLFSRLGRAWREWRARRDCRDFVARLSPHEAELQAKDVGLTAVELWRELGAMR